jgi:hypothetical protein
MIDFDRPTTEDADDADQSLPLSPQTHRPWRRSAIDWQRVNGQPLAAKRGVLHWIGTTTKGLLKWAAMLILTPVMGYVITGGIGAAMPVNADFQPTADGVEVFIRSDVFGSEIILPVQSAQYDWTSTFRSGAVFSPPQKKYAHLAIGWGDRELQLLDSEKSKSWRSQVQRSEIQRPFGQTMRAVALAIFTPTQPALRFRPVAKPSISSRSMRTNISLKQYRSLCQFIESTIDPLEPPMESLTDGEKEAGTRFFPARGHFHLFNNGHNWAGNAMKAAGIKVGRFTPLPKTVFWHLEN